MRGACAVRCRLAHRSDRPAAAEVLAGERSGAAADLGRTAIEDDLAAALAGPRPQVQDAVGLQHDLRIVLDHEQRIAGDRKSTRLNSSHSQISYAVFCLKKKTNTI